VKTLQTSYVGKSIQRRWSKTVDGPLGHSSPPPHEKLFSNQGQQNKAKKIDENTQLLASKKVNINP
jgi:hypothetical protein